MSSGGYVKLYRSLFKHEFFRPGKFSEREAFTWLIAEAAWKPRSRRVGQFYVDLDRGELVASLRHLGEIWQWEVGAVRGFLARSEKAAMLNTRSDKGITIVTVCNYDTYQGDEASDDKVSDKVPAQSKQGPDTGPAHAQHNTEEIKHSRRGKREEGETDSGSALTLFGDESGKPKATAPPVDYEGMFAVWYDIYPKKVDRTDALKSFIRVLKTKAATFEQLVAGARRYSAEVAGTEKKYIKGPAVWLNKGSWDNEPVVSPPAPARSGRVGSALQGIASRITQEDFDDGYRKDR